MKKRQKELKVKATLQLSHCEDKQLDESKDIISNAKLDFLIYENEQKLLKWEDSAGYYLRKAYTSEFQSSLKCKRRIERKHMQIAKTCKPITTFFASIISY
ncbi:hypothetical protein G9A89_001849 [Geosiphon pyriformis]|nr:hypothetical protein G9A89_001849 [Geosiphon pyriformis]